jgi:transketolase
VESAVAWQKAIEHQGPTCLLFSRQNLPFIERDPAVLNDVARGGYVLRDCNDLPEVIMIATGSEVALAVEAFNQLTAAGQRVRVVSMPSTDVFLAQPAEYQEKVLPSKVSARIVIEAAASDGWYKFVGCHGRVIGLDRFGLSAPAKEVFKEYGFTVEHVVSVAREVMARCISHSYGNQKLGHLENLL